MSFKNTDPTTLNIGPFRLLDKEWALLSAGTEKKFNTMTVSWGGMGTIWKKPAVTVYVRPQRYTKEFIDSTELFTLSFFGGEYKKKLAYLGSASGRDENKVAVSGLTPCFSAGENAPAFQEAQLILVCRKLYAQDMRPDCFVDESIIGDCYADGDFHTMYIGEVVSALVRE